MTQTTFYSKTADMVWTVDGTLKLKPELEAELQETLDAAKAEAAALEGEGPQGPDIATLEARLRSEIEKHPAYKYPDDTVVIDNAPGAGYTYNPETGEWDAPELDGYKAKAFQRIRATFDATVREMAGNPTQTEMASWPFKAAAAAAYKAGTATDDQLSQLEQWAAMKPDRTVEQFAGSVVAKFSAYSLLSDMAETKLNEAEAALEGYTDHTEVDALLEALPAHIEAAKVAYQEALAAQQ